MLDAEEAREAARELQTLQAVNLGMGAVMAGGETGNKLTERQLQLVRRANY